MTLDTVRGYVAALRAQKQTTVALDDLERLLARPAEPVTWPDESQRFVLSLSHKAMMQAWQATLSASEGAIRSSVLINGGAAVALLAFLGNVGVKATDTQALIHVSIRGMRWALELFGRGVLWATVALGARFLASYFGGLALSALPVSRLEDDKRRRREAETVARIANVATVFAMLVTLALAVMSFVMFLRGVTQAAGSVWGAGNS